MIRLITDAPQFFSDLGDVLRLFYGDVQISLPEGDTVFEHRFRHVPALRAMGGDIELSGRRARIRGVPALHGADVAATDLRGGAAMVIAALGARGESRISQLAHMERGYDRLVEKLRGLGAGIDTE